MKITRALFTFLSMSALTSAEWIKTAEVSFNEHDYFGRSVALAPGLLAVGAPYNAGNGRDSGTVRFYEREDESKRKKKKKNHHLDMVHEILGETQGVELGFAVDVSDDSKTVIIASPLKEASTGSDERIQPGSVKVYRYSDVLERWDQMGQELTGYGSQSEHFGRSVAISNDGLVIIIGAPKFDVLKRGRAAVYEFNAVEEIWIQKGQDLEGHVSHAQYGSSVDIVQRFNDDDTEIEKFYIAVGGPQAKRGRGIVQVFHYDEDLEDWNQVGDDIVGARFQDQLGHSLSLGYSRRKNYIFMAAGSPTAMSYYDTDDGDKQITHGHVQVFGFDASDEDELGIWDRVGDEIRQIEDEDGTGKSIELSRDGLRLIVGSPEYSHDKGAVRIFDYDDAKTTYVQVGSEIYGEEESGFGFSLSLSGLDLAVGSPYKNYVQLFRYDGETLYTGSDKKSRRSSFFSGLVKFIVVVGLVGVIAFFVVRKVQRRRQHARVETEEQDEWPFPFFSAQDRERIAEVRRLESQNVENEDVDRVVLHGMVRSDNGVNSPNNNDDDESSGSSESDDDDDDVSYEDDKNTRNIV